MKRIKQGGDINFRTKDITGLGRSYSIRFFTVDVETSIRKTQADADENGIIRLEWIELNTIGQGVLNFIADSKTDDSEYSDGTYNRTFSGTTEYYIASELVIPDGEDTETIIDAVNNIQNELNAEINRSTTRDAAHDTQISELGESVEDLRDDIANVYTKAEIDDMLDDVDLPDNVVVDANYVHTDNNFTTGEKNKLNGIASGAEVNVQSDWSVTDTSSDAYIQHKPTKVSDFSNDVGYITSYTETDPTVPAWAKQPHKPTYTASEVGALPSNTVIPTVDSTITGAAQANPVRGGAIYTELIGKAGYKYYADMDDMNDDNPANGTIGFDGDAERYYIYNAGGDEWIPIDRQILSTIVSNSSEPVASSAIYSALQGKTEKKNYTSYAAMTADSPELGTIAFEAEGEKFYIYDELNDEWKQIDGGGDLPANVVIDANYVHTDNNFTTAYKNVIDGLPDSITTEKLTATTSVSTKEMVFTPYYEDAPENNKIGLNAAFDKDNGRSIFEFYDYYSQASFYLPIIDGAEFVTTAGFPVKETNAGGSGTTQSSKLIPCTYNVLQVRNTRVRTINYSFTQGNTSYILLIDKNYMSGFPAVTTLNFEDITVTWEGGNAFDLATFRSGTDSYALINLLKISDEVVLGSFKLF